MSDVTTIRDPVEACVATVDVPLPSRTYSACDRGGPVNARFLPVVASGESFVAWALEPHAEAFSESDLAVLSERVDEDGWTLELQGRIRLSPKETK